MAGVSIGPGMSLVILRDALARESIDVERIRTVGDLVSQDESLIVIGPFFSVGPEKISEIEGLGLVYFIDFFEIASSGGNVPDWCAISLRKASSVP